MRKLLVLFAIMLFGLNIHAQIPQKMTYQAVVRDASNKLLVNKTIGVKISILKGTTVVFSEVYNPNPTTNQNGLLTLEIGGGTPLMGDIANIDWSDGPYFIKTEIDPLGGTTYSIQGTTQLLSVPYAFYAKTSGPVSEADPIFRASPAKNITEADITNWNNKLDSEVDGSVTNELQELSINGNQLSISDGNTVTLLTGSGGGDQWGSQVVESDETLTGDGTLSHPLGVDVDASAFDGWDKDVSDDFSGSYNDLANKPVTFFEIGGTNPPDNIKDNMYHIGKISLGTNTSYQRYNLYIKNTDSGAIANDIVFSNRFGNLIENTLTSNSTPSSTTYNCAVNNKLMGTGNIPIIGTHNEFINTGDGPHTGIRNYLHGGGDGKHIGTRNLISSYGNGLKFGTLNEIKSSGNSEQYATYNRIINTGSGKHYGVYDSLAGSGNGDQSGIYNLITNTGSGSHAGTSNLLSGTGTGAQYGTTNLITNTGDGEHIGTSNYLINRGSGKQYATYNSITNTGSGEHFGVYNSLAGSGNGDQYALYNTITNSGGGIHYGSYNYLSGTGRGAKYGVVAFIDSNAGGNNYGLYSILKGKGVGQKVGVYSYIDSLAGGVHYGVYSDVRKPNSYAGFFDGNVKITQKLVSSTSGTADMKAYIYGRIDGDGNIVTAASSDGFTCERNSTGRYRITFSSSMGINDYIVVATALGSSVPRVVNVAIAADTFTIHIHDLSSTYVNCLFHFVVYKK